MIYPYELKAKDVHAYTASVLKAHLKIKADGYRCHTDMIIDSLLKASAECSSVEAVCADLVDTADSNTVRDYLNQALNPKKLRQQEERANAALAECIPSALDRTCVELAVDFHDEPFCGKQTETRKLTCSGQAKKGTTHFVRIATAYIIWRQVRLTLAGFLVALVAIALISQSGQNITRPLIKEM